MPTLAETVVADLRAIFALRLNAVVVYGRHAVGPAPSELSTPPWTAYRLLIGQRARSTVDAARSEQFPFPPLAVHPEPSRCVQRGDCYRLAWAQAGGTAGEQPQV